MRRLLTRAARGLESLATVAVLFIISGALFPLLRSEADPTGLAPPTGIDSASYRFAYLFMLLQVILRPRTLLRVAIRNPLVPAVVLVAFLSVVWSDDPSRSLKEAAILWVWTLFGLYLVSRYSTKELLGHLGVALGIIAVLSLLFGLVVPDYGIAKDVEWRGVFIQKQQLGQMMLFACIVFVLLASVSRGWPRAAALIFLALAIVLIVLSRSKTALVILCALVVVVPAFLALRRGGLAAVAALCILLGGATAMAIAVTERELVLNALGKDVTLTGRTQLWAAVGKRIAVRPLLGYGYKAFWEEEVGASEGVRTEVDWDVPHSHNAFLDLWLDLGLLGLSTFLACYGVAGRRTWGALRGDVDLDGLWAMAILLMTVPQNMVASPLYENRLSWVIFVAVSACQAVRIRQFRPSKPETSSSQVAAPGFPLTRQEGLTHPHRQGS